MTTYSRLITALFHTPSSLAHAQAWDLFSHMRYVAHPHPDSLLFTQMIQACAIPNPAEPERALDLFTEMTVDREIPPTVGAYTAAILACARSGEMHADGARSAPIHIHLVPCWKVRNASATWVAYGLSHVRGIQASFQALHGPPGYPNPK